MLDLRLGSCSGLRLGLDRKELDVKDQRLIGSDGTSVGAAFAISKIGRNEELPLGADGHKLQRLGPTLDDLTNGEAGGLATLVGAVEFGAIDQSAAVIADDGVCGGGLGSCAGLNDLVLQAARER